jgi:anti-sigma regulatory factor (Ser/Thr protein kinase)
LSGGAESYARRDYDESVPKLGTVQRVNTTTDDRSGLQMSLPARAENVAVVRHALAGLAERLGMDEAGVADLKTVVTEACMNVVVHAYPDGQPGPLEIEAEPDLDGLTVVIRDYGLGIRPRPNTDGDHRPSLRIGLTLVAALSSSFEIKGGVDRGTEIRMHLPLVARAAEEVGQGRVATDAVRDATELTIGPPELLPPVLSRALSALAARREIGVDRLSDTMLLSDAISAGAPEAFADGNVRLSIVDRPDGVELRVGPMDDGGAERLRSSLDLPELGGSLANLADEVRVEQDDDGEFFVVGIATLAG